MPDHPDPDPDRAAPEPGTDDGPAPERAETPEPAEPDDTRTSAYEPL